MPKASTAITIRIIALSLLCISSQAFSAWDKNEVEEVIEDFKNNESVNVRNHITNSAQIYIDVSYADYIIDLRLKDCFVTTGTTAGISPYSCKKIKQGYPLFSPLITWE